MGGRYGSRAARVIGQVARGKTGGPAVDEGMELKRKRSPGFPFFHMPLIKVLCESSLRCFGWLGFSILFFFLF